MKKMRGSEAGGGSSWKESGALRLHLALPLRACEPLALFLVRPSASSKGASTSSVEQSDRLVSRNSW